MTSRNTRPYSRSSYSWVLVSQVHFAYCDCEFTNYMQAQLSQVVSLVNFYIEGELALLVLQVAALVQRYRSCLPTVLVG